MKSDMRFLSTEEFSPVAWLFFTPMFSSCPRPGWDRIVPVPMVQSGYHVMACPRWSASAGDIVRHGLRSVRPNRDGFSQTWITGFRNDQRRTGGKAASGVSFLASAVCSVGLLGSLRSVLPSSRQALLRGFSVALRLGSHLLPQALRVSVSPNKSRAQNALPRVGRFLLGPSEKADLGLGSRAHSHGCAQSALSRSGQKRRA